MLLQRRRTRGKAENARRFPRQLAAAFSMSSPLTNQTVAPLRYAPVGMTILFGNAMRCFQDELSSRPERSVVEGPAVSLTTNG